MQKKLILLVCAFSLQASSVNTIIETKNSANEKSLKSQAKIDTYSDESQKLFDEYLQLQKELKELQAYNKQLQNIVTTQNQEIPRLQNELKEVENTQKKIVPLMYEMIESLDKLVQKDTPFLFEERTQRLNNLNGFMANPSLGLSEQFKLILEAYKIEYNYARTLEVYRATLDSKRVNFLRVGRLALFYQSLDRSESGVYDLEHKKWIQLEDKYNSNITHAIKVATKKSAPDFLSLPMIAYGVQK